MAYGLSDGAPIARLRAALPRVVRRPLGYAWRRGREALYYLRGKNILRRYTTHYHTARRIFKRDGNRAELAVRSIREIGVRLVLPAGSDKLIALPDCYSALVARVAAAVSTRFEWSNGCRFYPRLADGSVPERIEDIAAIRNGEVITIQLLTPFDIDGVRDLCTPIMKELERKVYASYVIVDKVYIYRSPMSRQTPRASWLWHYDNHPHEVLKVMIYLTDVTNGTAPFAYLRCRRSENPLHGSPITPRFGNSRVPQDEVANHLASDCESHTVTGPRGTMLLFDGNTIHRANLAQDGHRDVLVFQVRPATFAPSSYMDDRWTGSFGELDINSDPSDLTPHPKG